MNGATLPPWLSPWAGGLVYGSRGAGVAGGASGASGASGSRERLRPRLTIYTLGHENSAPILSWSEDALAGSAAPALGPGGADGARRGLRWERVPIDRPPWHVDVPVPLSPAGAGRDRPPLFEKAEAESAAGAAAWSGVLRGWAAGAALLAVLVVAARLAEHFLDWKHLLRRRRQQRDWQRASVRATSGPEEGYAAEEGGGTLAACSVDLPPPYSELSPAIGGGEPKDEEAPPPYAEGDSCVQFLNKNGIPVLVYNRARAARDPAGRRHVERILLACGIPLASLGAVPPPACDSAALAPPDFSPTSVITIVAADGEPIQSCFIGAPSTPKDPPACAERADCDGARPEPAQSAAAPELAQPEAAADAATEGARDGSLPV